MWGQWVLHMGDGLEIKLAIKKGKKRGKNKNVAYFTEIT